MGSQEEARKITDNLIQRAEANRHIKFAFIKNLDSFFMIKKYAKAIHEVAKGFRIEATKFYNDYIAGLQQYVDNLQLLVNFKFFSKYADFYDIEECILNNMAYEYTRYLLQGHLVRQLAGYQRQDRDLVDYSLSGFKDEGGELPTSDDLFDPRD